MDLHWFYYEKWANQAVKENLKYMHILVSIAISQLCGSTLQQRERET